MSPVVVAVYGGKGGIGKTTTASNVAWLFGRDGHRTLAVDANVDQLSMQVIYDQLRGDPLYDLTIEEKPALLSRIKAVSYDRVVIDCPPSAREAGAALDVADHVVVPYVPRFLETRAIMKTVSEALAGRPYKVLFVAVEHSMRTRAGLARESLAGFGVPVYRAVIRKYIVHEKAQANGVPVFLPECASLDQFAPNAAQDYLDFYKELLAQLDGSKN